MVVASLLPPCAAWQGRNNAAMVAHWWNRAARDPAAAAMGRVPLAPDPVALAVQQAQLRQQDVKRSFVFFDLVTRGGMAVALVAVASQIFDASRTSVDM